MATTTGEFIRQLDAAGELARISAPVSPVLEIAEIADRESKSRAPALGSGASQRSDPAGAPLGGRALLFERVEGSQIPVLINALGSYRRLEMALGCADGEFGFEAIAERIGVLTKPEPPRSVSDAIRMLRQFAPLARIGPKRVGRGACQEQVWTGDQVDLTALPFLKCWPLDGDLSAVGYPEGANDGVPGADLRSDPGWQGRYITFASIHTIHADDAGEAKPASHNMGMYRVQLVGPRHLAMHWHMHHDGARHWRSWRARGDRMPIAIVLGGESVLPFATIAPMPPGISELLFAGFLNGRGIPMCPCKTIPLRVPANAEIVIEGWVDPRAGGPGFDPREAGAELGDGGFFEGPFGDHTGFYSLPDRYPLVEVSAITMRRDAVFPATIVGLPPQEDYYLGKATERIFLPLLRTIIPEILDYDLPTFGAFHNCAVIQIRKEYPLQGRRMMHAVWGAGQMSWTKVVIVVDDDVDVHDRRAVFEAISANCDMRRDLEVTRGPLDILDHAAPYLGAGSKLGIDATRKIEGEARGALALDPPASSGMDGALGQAIASLPGVTGISIPTGAGGACIFIGADSGADSRSLLRACVDAANSVGAGGVRVISLMGDGVALDDPDAALFHLCANMDPGRDLLVDPDSVCVGVDATPKAPGEIEGWPVRDWPPVIEMDEDTKCRVTERWAEYGLQA